MGLRMIERLRRTDSQLIDEAIERSTVDGVPISHEAARMIASLLHDGATSATYSFSSTGAIDEDRLLSEMLTTFNHPDTEDQVKVWINKFAEYMTSREDRGAQEGWSNQWIEDDEPHEDQCPRCRAHFSEPHAPECDINPDNPIFGELDVEDLDDEQRIQVAAFLQAKGRPGAIALEVMGVRYFLSVIDSFDEMYLGEYESFEAYVESWLLNTDSYDFLRWAPDNIREYVKIDVEMLARDWLASGYYVEQVDGTCYVFDFSR